MKKFGKGKSQVPAGEVEVEEVETPAETLKNAAAVGAEEVVEGEEKVKGAPRARKWNYGITAEGVIKRVAGVEGGPKGCADAFEATAKPITVEAFSEAVEDWRHCLRVMMRGKYVTITGADGEVYPQEYDHEAAAAAREAKAAAKAEREAAEAEEVEEAPKAPAKRSAKK